MVQVLIKFSLSFFLFFLSVIIYMHVWPFPSSFSLDQSIPFSSYSPPARSRYQSAFVSHCCFPIFTPNFRSLTRCRCCLSQSPRMQKPHLPRICKRNIKPPSTLTQSFISIHSHFTIHVFISINHTSNVHTISTTYNPYNKHSPPKKRHIPNHFLSHINPFI